MSSISMRTRFAAGWCAVTVCAFAAAQARASGFQFDTVYHGSAPMAGAPGGASLTDVDQVVVLEDGRVATLSRFAGNSAVTLNAAGDASVSVLAQQGQAIYGSPSGPTFGAFNNLAASSGRVTFVGEASGGTGNYGLFRYDSNLVGAEQIRIFYEGGTVGGRTASINAGSTPIFGVNSAGAVVFGASAPNSSGDQLLARWNVGDPEPSILLDQTSAQSGYNDTFVSPTKVMTANGAAVFTAFESGTRRVYGLDNSSPVPQQRVSDQFSTGGFDYQPIQVLAASGNAASGATLFQAFKDPNGSPELAVLLKTSSNNFVELGSFDGSGPLTMAAQMSAGGNVAAYIPSASGGKLVYLVDSPTASTPDLIATVGDALADGYDITKLSLAGGTAPMVNDLGLVIFDAEIEKDGETFAALLAWRKGTGPPTIILKSGDPLEVNGNMYSVASFLDSPVPFTPNAPWAALSSEADPLKDGLNDANLLAFGVKYLDGIDVRQAVLVTQIPEPIACWTIGAFALVGLARRRRR